MLVSSAVPATFCSRYHLREQYTYMIKIIP
nr:MAG TPA: hypothetical protein [Caudoviricetes sp.]